MEAALVTMAKGGQQLDVHPSCVADHERRGWRIAPAAEDRKPAAKTPLRRKAPLKDTQE